MKSASPSQQLAAFVAKYPPEIGALARACLPKLRKLIPGAFELVYDNYNALVIGFAPGERASEAVLSLALYPRWVNLFFLHGKKLKDPGKRLKGSGKQVRSVRIEEAATLDDVEVQALIRAAVQASAVPFNHEGKRRLIVKSISATQRPRRPKKG